MQMPEQAGATNINLRSPKVLMVEDNPANVKVVREYLERQGCQVFCAYSGQEGLNLAASVHPELILMDIQMPGMDGLTAIEHLRREERYDDVPILALTALAMPGDKERCLAAGANQYMSKPVSLVALYRAIQTHLKLIS
jgi:CheY-like chemotaxis protein